MRLHFHKWSKWARTNAVIYKGGRSVEVTLQYRMCDKCGRTQSDYV